MEGLAWPVMPGVKPAASEPGRLACERTVLTCLVYNTGVKASRNRSGRRETLGGRSVALGRPSTGKPSLHIRAPGSLLRWISKVTLRPRSFTCRPRLEGV
jgi:hypothetical protein